MFCTKLILKVVLDDFQTQQKYPWAGVGGGTTSPCEHQHLIFYSCESYHVTKRNITTVLSRALFFAIFPHLVGITIH